MLNRRIKNPLKPSIQGKGYIGEGPHLSYKNNKKTKEYSAWTDMLNRCYSEKYHERRPTYKDCSVSKDWLNFQNFATWFKANYFEGCQIDKDLKYPGNKVYSEDTCLMLTAEQNSFLICKQSKGICWISSRKKFKAGVRGESKRFDTEEEALEWYKEKKFSAINIITEDEDMKEMFRNYLSFYL